MAGDTLTVYWGEFLASPVPLELSFNYCSHSCAYCFANLNQPNRTADVKATMRLLADYRNRDTLEAKLLREGYPVLVSNRVDPFAASNYKQAVPVLRAMTELGIPVAIQTKGGYGVDDVLEFLPPSVWYISVAMLDDEIRRQIEPGAPTVESRFQLIEKLVSKGHRVAFALNPCVPEWLPDPLPLLQRAKASGAEGVWIERLHLNHKQEAQLSPREKAAMSQPVIDRAKKRNTAPADSQVFLRARECAQALGLEVFSIGQPTRSDYFKTYREVYAKTFPIIQDFVNACYDDEVGADDILTFADFLEVCGVGLPEGKLRIGHYLGASAHNIWHTHKLSNWLTYKQLLAIIWTDERAKQCPARMPAFAWAGKWDGDGWFQLVDDKELPYLCFNPNGFDDFFIHYEGKEGN